MVQQYMDQHGVDRVEASRMIAEELVRDMHDAESDNVSSPPAPRPRNRNNSVLMNANAVDFDYRKYHEEALRMAEIKPANTILPHIPEGMKVLDVMPFDWTSVADVKRDVIDGPEQLRIKNANTQTNKAGSISVINHACMSQGHSVINIQGLNLNDVGDEMVEKTTPHEPERASHKKGWMHHLLACQDPLVAISTEKIVPVFR
jgi:hypothetical protein